MSLYSIKKLPQEVSNEGLLELTNVTKKDFATSYLNDDNISHQVSIKAGKSEKFTLPIGKVIENHLAMFVLHQRDFDYKTSVNVELEKIKTEISRQA
jgi:hypothetical protein